MHTEYCTCSHPDGPYDLSPVLARVGSWAITTYGLEHLGPAYTIEHTELWRQDWEAHMAEKDWVGADFPNALKLAQKTHASRDSDWDRQTQEIHERAEAAAEGETDSD